MRALALTSAALTVALLAGAPSASAAQRTETERFSRRVPLSPGGTLRLKNFSGKVVITGGDRNEVSIEAVRRATRDRLDRIKLDVQASGSTVTVEANKADSWWSAHMGSNVVETDFEITVPSRINLDVSVFSSGVTVTNVSGRHEVQGFSADLRLNGIAGPLRAHTFSGNIRVDLARSEDRPELDLYTFSGDIEVRVPENARAGVTFNSFSGDLRSDVPLTLKRSSRRSLRGELGAGNGRNVKFRTFSGDVRIVR